MNGELPLSNHKFETFSQLVAKGANYTEAATELGYSKQTAAAQASRIMKRGDVQLRVQFLKTVIAKNTVETTAAAVVKYGLTKEWVIEQLMENVMIAKAAVPVIIDGEETGEYRTNLPAANKALELLGQEIGMFQKNLNVKHDGLDPLTQFIREITNSAIPISRQPITIDHDDDSDD